MFFKISALKNFKLFSLFLFVSVCVCLRPPTVKPLSVRDLNSREQTNDFVLKMFLSKSLHRYFSMNHRAFLTSRFIPVHTLEVGKATT